MDIHGSPAPAPTPTPGRLKGKKTGMILCWLFGMGTLVASMSMASIGDYYYQLFPAYHFERVLNLICQPFALATLAILAYMEARVDTRKRNLIGFTLFFLSTFSLITLDIATSGNGGIRNYIVVCIVLAVFGISGGLVEGGIVGDLYFMCPEFIQSYVAGLGLSGVITSGLRMIIKSAFDNSRGNLRKGAMLFLGISTFIELLCIVSYAYVFSKLPIVKDFRAKAASQGATTVASDLAAAGIQGQVNVENESERLSTKQLLVQNIDYALDVYLIYALSTAIVPGFIYENTGSHRLGSWYALVLVGMFNLADFISRYIPVVDCLRIESRKGLFSAAFSRLFIIPAFYFTSVYADQGWMMFLTSFLGLTNGYLTVCVMVTAPKRYRAPEQNSLGNLLVAFLLGGISSGAALNWLWLIGK